MNFLGVSFHTRVDDWISAVGTPHTDAGKGQCAVSTPHTDAGKGQCAVSTPHTDAGKGQCAVRTPHTDAGKDTKKKQLKKKSLVIEFDIFLLQNQNCIYHLIKLV